MDISFLLVTVVVMAVVALITIWSIKRSVQPSTAAGKRRRTIFLRFILAQYVIITTLALLTVEKIIQPRLLGLLGIANFVGSFLILWTALKRAPIAEQDITQEQRVRAVKSSKFLIAVYAFALLNGLFHIHDVPLIGLVVGIAVNVLILTLLFTNLRKNQAKLNPEKQ
jgi:hypothetical protein